MGGDRRQLNIRGANLILPIGQNEQASCLYFEYMFGTVVVITSKSRWLFVLQTLQSIGTIHIVWVLTAERLLDFRVSSAINTNVWSHHG